MKSNSIVRATLAVMIFTSCHKNNGWGVQGRGEVVRETRQLYSADRIHLCIDADVTYRQDSLYFLEVSAQPNILSILESDVEGGTLKFSYRRNVWQHKQVKITVHTPHISGLRISGSGSIRSESPVTASRLDLQISGSGDISLAKLTSGEVSADISGSGDISLSDGQCNHQAYTISGSGDIRAENFRGTSNVSRISGSGNMDVHVLESLSVKISGSGDLRYRGRPAVTADISGSGKVTQVN